MQQYVYSANLLFTVSSRRDILKRIATSLIALVLLTVPAHAEQVALVGLGTLSYKLEDESTDKFLGGLGGEYLYFGEENNLFFGASLARFTVCRASADWGCGDWKEPWYKTKLSAGYDLENSLFTPYVSVLHSRLDLDFEIHEDFRILEETSNDTSLGLGTYIGNPGPGFRGFAALQGIGGAELSFAVGVYRTRWNNMVLGGSYETPVDDPFNLLSTINLRIGYSF